MKKVKKSVSLLLMSGMLLSALTFTSCKKNNVDDPTLPQIGGYDTSDDVAAQNLITKFSFDNSVDDAKSTATGGTAVNTGFTSGVKGEAFQGAASGNTGYVGYTNVGNALKDVQSFTVSFWVNTTNHEDGASSLFMLSNDSSWIGNMFVLQESGPVGVDSIRFKFKFDKWDPNTTWKEQWIELGGEHRIAGISNKWSHIAFNYDATSSKFNVFVNGEKKALPDDITNRYNNDPSAGGSALGSLKFANANKFIVGGFQSQMVGNPDAWMKSFSGNLDELRVYNKALSDADIKALYELETAGR
jgi:hypothetical protein